MVYKLTKKDVNTKVQKMLEICSDCELVDAINVFKYGLVATFRVGLEVVPNHLKSHVIDDLISDIREKIECEIKKETLN